MILDGETIGCRLSIHEGVKCYRFKSDEMEQLLPFLMKAAALVRAELSQKKAELEEQGKPMVYARPAELINRLADEVDVALSQHSPEGGRLERRGNTTRS